MVKYGEQWDGGQVERRKIQSTKTDRESVVDTPSISIPEQERLRCC